MRPDEDLPRLTRERVCPLQCRQLAINRGIGHLIALALRDVVPDLGDVECLRAKRGEVPAEVRHRQLRAAERAPTVDLVLRDEIVEQLVDEDLLSARSDRLAVRDRARALVQQVLRITFERTLAALAHRLTIPVVLDPPDIPALEETAASPALHRRPRSPSHASIARRICSAGFTPLSSDFAFIAST